MGWPLPWSYPDLLETECSGCGRRRICLIIFTEHDQHGEPTGPHELRCRSCQIADGDPLITMTPYRTETSP